MGLVIRSLDDLPDESDREYYIYLLDFGWNEPLGQALKDNFDRIATSVSNHKGVVIRRSFDSVHYNDEVLSYHSINGEDVEEEGLLPAILITNRHPTEFKKRAENNKQTNEKPDPNFGMVIIPLKKVCETTTDVVDILIKIINDVRNKKDLNNFKVAKELKPGVGKAIAKALILEPNFYGIGFSFERLKKELK